jgi:peptidoglycan/LPS O-acetylase OafA/YrhL
MLQVVRSAWHDVRPTRKYHPAVDGLRAIAILSVVAYHVGIPGFGGGFVGVDVFFVISGFLIINQIVDEARADQFSLMTFWAKRCMRILPPFILVLLATSLLATYFLVAPSEFQDFGPSIASSGAMIANHFFWQQQQSYFAAASDLKPLLHMWTLSVEEQFYLLAPLLVGALIWLGRFARQTSLAIAATLFSLSLFACAASLAHPKTAFYLMPFRAWEFMLGGAIPIVLPLIQRLSPRMLIGAAAASLTTIIGAVCLYSERLAYPSYLALAPTLATATLIAIALATPTHTAARFLGAAPLVSIGLVSYGWYLWHWPLLSFSRFYHFGQRQIAADLLAAFLALLLSIAMYLSLERWTKRIRGEGGQALSRSALLAMASLAATVAGGYWLSGHFAETARAEWIAHALPERIKYFWTEGAACNLNQLPISQIPPACANAPWAISWGLLMGDSHAMTAFGTYADLARQSDAQLLVRVDGACPPLLETRMVYDWPPHVACLEGMRQTVQLVEREQGKVQFVILKARWTVFLKNTIGLPDFSDDPLQGVTQQLRHTIDVFRRLGVKRILVVGPEPLLSGDGPTCLLRAIQKRGDPHLKCGVSRDAIEQKERKLANAVAASVTGADARYVDPIAALCDSSWCPVDRNGEALFVDTAHLTPYAERIVAQTYAADFRWVVGRNGAAEGEPRTGQ